MKQFKLIIVIAAVIIMATSCSLTSKKTTEMKNKIKQIAVFGDGLSDMGRWGKLTNYQYPPASQGFFESRWTNGKVWIELVADSLGLKIDFDNNFAMGGATTGTYNINEPLKSALGLDSTAQLQGMLAQVQQFLNLNQAVDSSILFVLWAGGHDIGSYLDYGQPDLQQYPPAGNYKVAIELLVKAGAKKFLVGTMPDMGFTPVYFGTDKQAMASALCSSLNSGLDELIKTYENTDIQFYVLDGAAIFAKVGSNPGQFGFKYTDAFLPINVIDFSNPLKISDVAITNREKGLNPDEFLNWWAVSASAKMHKILADEALRTLNNKK